MIQDNIITLRTYALEMEAEMARATLDAHGIPAAVSRDDCGGMEPQLNISGGARLKVTQRNARAALDILDSPDNALTAAEEDAGEAQERLRVDADTA